MIIENNIKIWDIHHDSTGTRTLKIITKKERKPHKYFVNFIDKMKNGDSVLCTNSEYIRIWESAIKKGIKITSRSESGNRRVWVI